METNHEYDSLVYAYLSAKQIQGLYEALEYEANPHSVSVELVHEGRSRVIICTPLEYAEYFRDIMRVLKSIQ